MEENLVASNCDGYSEIYVSAVVSPHRFFVQMVGPRSIELDRLVGDMTDYYSDEHTPKLPLKNVNYLTN